MYCVSAGPSLRAMAMERDELKRWLRAVLEFKGLSGKQLADRIGVVASTINRFLNDVDVQHSLSPKTLKKIEDYTRIPAGSFPRVANPGFGEADGLRLGGDVQTGDLAIDAIVRALSATHQNMDPWLLKSTALVGLGYVPGDVLLVDLSERPQPGDVVCAQIYDWARTTAQTVFRVYEPPYLVAVTPNPQFMKPIVVDDENVIIKGVVVQSLRARRSRQIQAEFGRQRVAHT